jgi:hypothetical protein
MGRGTPADEARRAGHAALAAMIETYRPEPAAVGESDVTAGHEASVVHQHTGTESP